VISKQEELEGIVFTEAEVVDLDFEGLTAAETFDSIPDLDSEFTDTSSSDSDAEPAPQSGPKFCRAPQCGVGTSWEVQKPPTEIIAKEAPEIIKNLLRPRREGNKARYKESAVKGWSLRVLTEIQTFLNLFTGDKSKFKGRWMEARLKQHKPIQNQQNMHMRCSETELKNLLQITKFQKCCIQHF
jgi:hypothetical protein